MTKNKVSSAMFFVLLAGLIWSFGPLVVRNMDNAELVPWQYSLIRGSAIFIILNLYLFLAEGSKFTNNYNKIGLSKKELRMLWGMHKKLKNLPKS